MSAIEFLAAYDVSLSGIEILKILERIGLRDPSYEAKFYHVLFVRHDSDESIVEVIGWKYNLGLENGRIQWSKLQPVLLYSKEK